MKIKCDFCKTEYTLAVPPTTPVKCAVCGRVWTPTTPNARRRATFTFIAAICALLSALIFVFAIITRSHMDDIRTRPIIAEITAADIENDDAGVAHYVVRGRITNLTDEIYGVPDMIIVSRDAQGNPIARQRLMPPATLLDVGATVDFSARLNSPTTGVKQITIEIQNTGGDK